MTNAYDLDEDHGFVDAHENETRNNLVEINAESFGKCYAILPCGHFCLCISSAPRDWLSSTESAPWESA